MHTKNIQHAHDIYKKKFYFGYDHLGTIKRLYNEQRQLVKAIEYESFGNILEETLPELFIPLGFAGGLRDKDTTFIKYMYRDYYPYIGHFLCIDPAKDYGTDGDYYDYCSDDPVGRFDPLGLMSIIAPGYDMMSDEEKEDLHEDIEIIVKGGTRDITGFGGKTLGKKLGGTGVPILGRIGLGQLTDKAFDELDYPDGPIGNTINKGKKA